MPDLPNRREEEAALAFLLMQKFDEYRDEISGLIGTPPDASQIPQSFYDRLENEVSTLVAIHLERISGESAGRLSGALGAPDVVGQAASDLVNWARERAQELARQMLERTRDLIADIVREATEQAESARAATEAAIAGMAAIFSSQRAESISATETTGAVSAGERTVAREIEAQLGVTLVSRWVTERDGRVCAVCLPLDGAANEEWEQAFPNGPPAHPSCRCYLEHEIESGLPEPSDN